MILLNTRKAAEFLTMKPQTLDLWRTRSQGPRFLKIGKSVRYREADLIQFLEESERHSTSDNGEGRGQ